MAAAVDNRMYERLVDRHNETRTMIEDIHRRLNRMHTILSAVCVVVGLLGSVLGAALWLK